MIPGGTRMITLCFAKINVDLVMLVKVKYFKQWIRDNASAGTAGQSF